MVLQTISDRTAKIAALSTAIAFLAFAQIAIFVLPAYYSADSNNMVDIAEYLIAGGDKSFEAIAYLIRILSLPVASAMVQAAGVLTILYVMSDRKLVATAGAALFSLAVLVPLGLVRPQKEIIVLLLTAICVLIVQRSRRPFTAFVLTLMAYAAYSYESYRLYYLLITGVIALLFLFEQLSVRARFVFVLLVFAGGFFVPHSIFEQLRLSRDAVNVLRDLYPEVAGNRTAFSNPFQIDSWLGFLGNYAAAIIRLNVPLLYWRTPNEVVLTVFAWIWFYLIYLGYTVGEWRARFCARLLLSHALVLWIFEPDLGSYLRHFSSCILYLVPIFRAIEERALSASTSRVGEIVADPQ